MSFRGRGRGGNRGRGRGKESRKRERSDEDSLNEVNLPNIIINKVYYTLTQIKHNVNGGTYLPFLS